MNRQTEIAALCERVLAAPRSNGLTVAVPLDEEERFRKLWAGDMTDYDENHSRADLALCGILSHGVSTMTFSGLMKNSASPACTGRNGNAQITAPPRFSRLPRANRSLISSDDEPIEDDGITEYLVDALPEPMHEGWFPQGRGVTNRRVIGRGQDIVGHAAARANPQRRGRIRPQLRSRVTIGCSCMTDPNKAMQRTVKSLGLSGCD